MASRTILFRFDSTTVSLQRHRTLNLEVLAITVIQQHKDPAIGSPGPAQMCRNRPTATSRLRWIQDEEQHKRHGDETRPPRDPAKPDPNARSESAARRSFSVTRLHPSRDTILVMLPARSAIPGRRPAFHSATNNATGAMVRGWLPSVNPTKVTSNGSRYLIS